MKKSDAEAVVAFVSRVTVIGCNGANEIERFMAKVTDVPAPPRVKCVEERCPCPCVLGFIRCEAHAATYQPPVPGPTSARVVAYEGVAKAANKLIYGSVGTISDRVTDLRNAITTLDSTP